MAIFQDLPVEIMSHILAFIADLRYSHDRQVTLCSASLVCSTWTEPTQQALMTNIEIGDARTARRLLESQLLSRYSVHSLVLGSKKASCRTWINYVRRILLEGVKGVHKLALIGLEEFDPTWIVGEPFQNLQSLYVDFCSFQVIEPEDSALTLPSLRALTIRHTSYAELAYPPYTTPRLDSIRLIHGERRPFPLPVVDSDHGAEPLVARLLSVNAHRLRQVVITVSHRPYLVKLVSFNMPHCTRLEQLGLQFYPKTYPSRAPIAECFMDVFKAIGESKYRLRQLMLFQLSDLQGEMLREALARSLRQGSLSRDQLEGLRVTWKTGVVDPYVSRAANLTRKLSKLCQDAGIEFQQGAESTGPALLEWPYDEGSRCIELGQRL